MSNLGFYRAKELLFKTYEIAKNYKFNSDDYNPLFLNMNKAHVDTVQLYHFSESKMFVFVCIHSERKFVLRYN